MELTSTENNCKIGAAIKRRRNELSWSLEKLGSVLHVSGRQIQRYENGENTISADKLHDVSIALSVPYCYFFIDSSAQKTAKPNECYEFFANYGNPHNNDIKAMATDFMRIASQYGDKRGVPALRLGNYKKLIPILVVDDDESVLGITKLLLECEGYRNLHLIQDSRTVIPFLNEKEVSIIVMDLMMPHLMGNELLPTIKHDFPKIPVIIMTAVGDMDIAEDCKKLGAFDFLVKPVEPMTLLSAIERTMIN
ncbi:MAG: response regulator [Geobacteraceae bacterium]|jgi:CheY-like chemotaxis protein